MNVHLVHIRVCNFGESGQPEFAVQISDRLKMVPISSYIIRFDLNGFINHKTLNYGILFGKGASQ